MTHQVSLWWMMMKLCRNLHGVLPYADRFCRDQEVIEDYQ